MNAKRKDEGDQMMDQWAELAEVDVRIEGGEIWEPLRVERIGPTTYLLLEPSWWTAHPAGAVVRGRLDARGRLLIEECLRPSPLEARSFFVRESALPRLQRPLSELMGRGGRWQHALGGVLMVHGRPELLEWFESALRTVLEEAGAEPTSPPASESGGDGAPPSVPLGEVARFPARPRDEED